MVRTYKLGEVFSIRSGKTPSTQNKEYWCSHLEKCDCIPWFTGKDITQQKVLNTERKITPLAFRECSMNLTTENSVLFNYLECSPYYLGKKGIACQGGGGGTHILEPNPKLIYPNYLYYLLLSVKNKMRIWRSGTAQLKIRGGELIELSVSLPPLPEQKIILQKFQIVYNTLFQSEVIYNDFLLKMKKKYLELGDLLFLKYKNSKIVIKDYFVLSIGQTPLTKKVEYYQNGTIKWINSGVLTDLYFLTDKTSASRLITKKAFQERNLKFTLKNSVLLNLIGGNLTWCQSDNYTFNQSVINFRSEKELDCATLFFALRQIYFSVYASGSVFNSLTKNVLLNIKIDWVSDPEKQKIFFTILDSKLAKIKDLHSQIKDLHSQIKDLLLLKYFGRK